MYKDALIFFLQETVEKRQEGLFGDFALAEYLFKLGDVNKDKYLDSNEIYNFYRHHIKFDFDKSAKMSIKLMNIGDSDKDGRLGEIGNRKLHANSLN